MTTIPVLDRPHVPGGPPGLEDEPPPESAFNRAARELAAIPGCVDMTHLPAGSVVVVSGGARGVTAACVLALVRETQCKVVVLARTPLIGEPAGLESARTDAGPGSIADEGRPQPDRKA